MTSIIERRAADPDTLLVVCDFTPPRGADTEALGAASTLEADWISVAYNPGKATRVNAAAAAPEHVKRSHGVPSSPTPPP